jgi:hypothetical protein
LEIDIEPSSSYPASYPQPDSSALYSALHALIGRMDNMISEDHDRMKALEIEAAYWKSEALRAMAN